MCVGSLPLPFSLVTALHCRGHWSSTTAHYHVDFKGDSSGFLKCGCVIVYLLIVSVLHAVDHGRNAPSLEKQKGVLTESSYCMYCCGLTEKTYFNHLQKQPS